MKGAAMAYATLKVRAAMSNGLSLILSLEYLIRGPFPCPRKGNMLARMEPLQHKDGSCDGIG